MQKVVLVLYMINMGRWSELRSFRVCQVVRLESPAVMVVTSGEVGCWSS